MRPGMTGPFGSAAACASLMRLSPAQTANAFGVAGSLAGGLLAFAKAGSGGMIKRLHLGRAAEGGVVAARLAQRGYEGPLTVLEGRYGLLDAFCEENDPSLLTKGLGETWEMERLCYQALSLPRDLACAGAAHARLHGGARLCRRRYRRDRGRCVRRRSCRITAASNPDRHHAGAVQRAVQSGDRRLLRSTRSFRLQRRHRGRTAPARACTPRARDRGGRSQGLERALAVYAARWPPYRGCERILSRLPGNPAVGRPVAFKSSSGSARMCPLGCSTRCSPSCCGWKSFPRYRL